MIQRPSVSNPQSYSPTVTFRRLRVEFDISTGDCLSSQLTVATAENHRLLNPEATFSIHYVPLKPAFCYTPKGEAPMSVIFGLHAIGERRVQLAIAKDHEAATKVRLALHKQSAV